MRPFDPPANANLPAVAAPFWLQLPAASYAAAVDLAVAQLQYWSALHEVMFNMHRRMWGGAAAVRAAEDSPVMALTAADMRSAGAAVFQAQRDAMAAWRRSA